jgi:hypothetical protein
MLTIPLVANLPYYRVATAIEGVTYIFVARWNRRDNAWYFDLLDQRETPVLTGIKLVLGGYLGRASNHPLLTAGTFAAVDTSGAGREATYTDLGARVELRYLTALFTVAKLAGDLV